jgi:rare lipoprotein A
VIRCLVIAALLIALPAWAGPRVASWYGEEHRGRLMANGRPFDPDRLTCASWFFPLGTRLNVGHAGRWVTVEVTDRGPHRRLVRQGRVIDLSREAFRRIGDLNNGLVPVKLRYAK